MRRIVVLSALVLSLVSCSDGASSPTAVAAPPPTPAPPPPPPPPPPPAVQMAGAWSGSIQAGDSVPDLREQDALACLEHRELQPGTSRGIRADFRQVAAVLEGIVQREGHLTFEVLSGQVTGSSFEFGMHLTRGSNWSACPGPLGRPHYSMNVTRWHVRGVANVNGSPRDRLTGELELTWKVDYADQFVGYIRQTHTLTLRR